uniref:Uncharacterized protein n=1 Tax=Ditylenchus dipsaci TaxID=166011 RepID=A0A915EL21_9BILA
MRLEIVMGLLSSFQIYHQCMSNTLSLLDFGYSPLQLSAVSDYSAGFLICGSVLMFIPLTIFLCLARFVIGLGVGIAFVSAFVALNDGANFSSSLTSRSQAFLGTAALFSAATFLVNASAYFRSMSYLMVVTIFAVPSLLAGFNYFWHRLEYAELNYSTLESRKKEYEELEPQQISCVEQPLKISSKKLVLKCSPKLLAVVLMCINATIGVPIILAFCSIIYQNMGLSQIASIHLSTFYPLLQLVVILSLRHWSIVGKQFPIDTFCL